MRISHFFSLFLLAEGVLALFIQFLSFFLSCLEILVLLSFCMDFRVEGDSKKTQIHIHIVFLFYIT